MATATPSTDSRRSWVKDYLVPQLAHIVPLICVWMLAAGYPSQAWAVRIPLILTAAYGLFCWTSRFHETAHQTVPFMSPRFAIMTGKQIGLVLLVPYHCYRECHIRHHAYLNRPIDWELWPYSDPKTSIWFRRTFVVLDLLFGFLTAPYVYSRIYFHRDSPLKPEVRREIAVEYTYMVAIWGALLTFVAYYGYWENFLIAWVLPHWLAGVLQVGRKLTEHLGMASFDPMKGTRTVVGKSWVTRFCSYLNFDIFVHGPHHRYPRLTHDKLKGRMNEHIETHPEIRFPMFATYTGAVLNMLPCLWTRPGVGLNAGAAAMSDVTVDDVGEFLEDAKQVVNGNWDSNPVHNSEDQTAADEASAPVPYARHAAAEDSSSASADAAQDVSAIHS
ncbi:MAG: fatty acid desaturase [Planctomycetaceae bacterium]